MSKQEKLLYLGSRGWFIFSYRNFFGMKFAYRYRKTLRANYNSSWHPLNEAYEIQVFLDSHKSYFEQKPTELHERVVAEAKALLDDEGNKIKDDYDYVEQRNQLRDAISELERNK